MRCLIVAVTGLLVMMAGLASAQPDAFRTTADMAVREWVVEKNRLLNPVQVKVDIDNEARQVFLSAYLERAQSFLATGEPAYDEVAAYATGRPAAFFLEKENFYKTFGGSKVSYANTAWIAPQIRRNVNAFLDQYLILYQVRRPGDKTIFLKVDDIIKNSPKLLDDCDLPPRTRLWCKH